MLDRVIRYLIYHVFRQVPVSAQDAFKTASVDSLRKAVCYNQGKVANYTFVSSRLHKKLKSELKLIENLNSQQIPDENLKSLNLAFQSLSDYLEFEFREACRYNFNFLINFLGYKSWQKPLRVCVKAIRQDNIITLARDRRAYSIEVEEAQPDPASSNTAFVEINNTGRHYVCNNIPQAIKRGAYQNARIYRDDVRSDYSLPSFINHLRHRYTNSCDTKWRRHWRRDKHGRLPPIETCYKSTLVIPMSLVNSEEHLSDEFRAYFEIDSSRQLTIFGFLCLDSQHIDFFRSQEDVDLGYIFADLLSLYLIQRLTCTSYSRSFERALLILQENGGNLNA